MTLEKTWSYEDYSALPEDGNRYEIIDGRLYVTPAPRTFHQKVIGRLVRVLDALELGGQGWVYTAPIDVRMQGADPVQPDILFLERTQRSQIEEKWIQGAPFLAIEVLSPSTAARDRTIKLNNYALNRIPWYWIVDPQACTFEAYRLEVDGYRVEASLNQGAYTWAPYPEVRIDLETLFAPLPD